MIFFSVQPLCSLCLCRGYYRRILNHRDISEHGGCTEKTEIGALLTEV